MTKTFNYTTHSTLIKDRCTQMKSDWFTKMKMCDEMSVIKTKYRTQTQEKEDAFEELSILYDHYIKNSKKWNNSIKDEKMNTKAQKIEIKKKTIEYELNSLTQMYEILENKYRECYTDAEKIRKKLFKMNKTPLK